MPKLFELLKKWSAGLRKRVEPAQNPVAQSIHAPACSQSITQTSTPPLHAPLLEALSRFQRGELPVGQVLFHGCSATARDIDVLGKRLTGTRKWFSWDASYACDYGRGYGGADNNGLLWVCRVTKLIPALVGSQASLIEFTPWTSEFPSKLPNEFERYACQTLNKSAPVALLDFPREVGFEEVLITSPEHVIEVLEVHRLPADRKQARDFGRKQNEAYGYTCT